MQAKGIIYKEEKKMRPCVKTVFASSNTISCLVLPDQQVIMLVVLSLAPLSQTDLRMTTASPLEVGRKADMFVFRISPLLHLPACKGRHRASFARLVSV